VYVWKDYHPSFQSFGGCCIDITKQCIERDVNTLSFIHSVDTFVSDVIQYKANDIEYISSF